ncbi:hypothetical protein BDZ97DRAFT_1920205 [Flammula alnicola]|nr:hypothetical protein BDZ97DRAFT_1920205 [Flammula alnicola]
MFNFLQGPHNALYQDPKTHYKPHEVVRLLIDSNQTFDIVATIWLRTSGQSTLDSKGERSGPLTKEAISTDTVFRGLQLKDKNVRTSVNFRVPIETLNNTTEWAYAPYISVSENAWGPLDLIPVPVNREECRKSSSDSPRNDNVEVPNQEFVDITWNISFSGRSPGKLAFTDTVVTLATAAHESGEFKFNMTDTTENKEMLHWNVEFAQDIIGNTFRHDYHPRRHFFLDNVGVVFLLIQIVLDFSTTVTSAYILESALEIVLKGYERKFHLSDWFWAVLSAIPMHLTTIVMIKAITSAEIHWLTKWIPTVRFAPATHLERASQRLNIRASRHYKLSTFVFVMLGIMFFLSSHYPPPRSGVWPPLPCI